MKAMRNTWSLGILFLATACASEPVDRPEAAGEHTAAQAPVQGSVPIARPARPTSPDAHPGVVAASPQEPPRPAEDAGAAAAVTDPGTAAPAPRALDPFEITIPGTTTKLAFLPVPADPADPGSRAFWLARTETTWDAYDAFVFALDRAEGQTDPPDAFARPSKPYILMDRGFGHAGYPAISTSYKGASEFCRWLSHQTGRRFRLPTEAEWERAAKLGGDADRALADVAWFEGNSSVDERPSTHPIATRAADALGFHDLLGNAAEWTTGPEAQGIARGGSFREGPEAVNGTARRPDDKSLNKTDPQRPRSVWWLADGGFIGFRVLCEPGDG